MVWTSDIANEGKGATIERISLGSWESRVALKSVHKEHGSDLVATANEAHQGTCLGW
jgi:hypothetical protein